MRQTLYSLAILTALAALPAAALTPSQLDRDEAEAYNRYKDNPAASQAFLDTREYMHKIRAVANGSAPARPMPRRPSTFDDSYLLQGDNDTIDRAISKGVNAVAGALWTTRA